MGNTITAIRKPSVWLYVDERCQEVTEVFLSPEPLSVAIIPKLPTTPLRNCTPVVQRQMRNVVLSPSYRDVSSRPDKRAKKEYLEREAFRQLPHLDDLDERQRRRFATAIYGVINRAVRQQKRSRTKYTKRRRQRDIDQLDS